MKRVLSGIRATGRLHLGNYLGAVKGMLELQKNPDYEQLYMVADLHTITTPYNISELKRNRREVIIDYLSAGLDPRKTILFLQAEVSQHAELAFYFSSVTTVARMQHLPTFKDKVKQHPQHVTMALLNYPILMSADILIYKAHLVPVGIDQEPHLEISREIARNMNTMYGTHFPEPVRFKTEGEYVPSLSGEGKMSKSVAGSFITLTDDLDTIKSKVAKIPTDSGKGTVHTTGLETTYANEEGIVSDGVKTLFTFVQLFEGVHTRKEYEHAYQTTGIRYGEVKNKLSEAIFAELAPLQEKRAYYTAHMHEVDEIIVHGTKRATELARQTIAEVKEKMGLG